MMTVRTEYKTNTRVTFIQLYICTAVCIEDLCYIIADYTVVHSQSSSFSCEKQVLFLYLFFHLFQLLLWMENFTSHKWR